MKEFSRFSKAEDVEEEVDLDPNERYTSFDALVDVAEYHIRKEELQREQQLSDPSPTNTCEGCNQYISSQNAEKPLAVDNGCEKILDISIPRKARTKQAALDVSKLEKKMAMTNQRIISNKSEYPEGMSREEVLRRERLLKRPMEFDFENVVQKRAKRDCKRVVRSKDPDYDSKEEFQEMKKTQKKSSRMTTNNSKKEEEENKNKGCFGIQDLEILNPPQVLPEKFMSRIKAMGGKNEILVITKRLTATDCKGGEGRLSMPFSKIKVFLFENERIYLQQRNKSNGKNGKKVVLIQPNLEEIDMNLKQWDMPKPNGNSKSKMYVLVKPWNDVVRENRLREGEEIQVWSFRVGKEEELRLAIVRLSDFYGDGTSNVGQLMYGEGTSNVGQLIPYGEGPSNVGQLPDSEEPADVGQSTGNVNDCIGTSVNGKEPADVGQLQNGEESDDDFDQVVQELIDLCQRKKGLYKEHYRRMMQRMGVVGGCTSWLANI